MHVCLLHRGKKMENTESPQNVPNQRKMPIKLWMWSALAIWVICVVLVDEWFTKMPLIVSYWLHSAPYSSPSTRLYGLQKIPSPAWWLILHINSATMVTVLTALCVLSQRSIYRMGLVCFCLFRLAHSLFLLTVLYQIHKLADLDVYSAIFANSCLMYSLYWADKHNNPFLYLVVMSIALILTTIANGHLIQLVTVAFFITFILGLFELYSNTNQKLDKSLPVVVVPSVASH